MHCINQKPKKMSMKKCKKKKGYSKKGYKGGKK